MFSLNYNVINLFLSRKLFEAIPKEQVIDIIKPEPTGHYSRIIWFLYDWLTVIQLLNKDLTRGNYVKLLDQSIQFGILSVNLLLKQWIVDNLIWERGFCSLIYPSSIFEQFLKMIFLH